jgi:hypothetical protein
MGREIHTYWPEPEGKTVWGPRSRRDHNIAMNPEDREYKDVDWISLNISLNMAINFEVP